ncbi:thioredoxin-dependent thiol peroxidase [Corynebacterium heidelbergense]|uniref:thioredoxin-dependent peroxiredoxin n=1 Tax=Corynebacterium heidelbergense TaxID=2055947 RepID=A0A364VD64_9CORY|nr:thioredoxin-dependent thiol peroxidase [Corynebacterium heidelbergense]RAV34506.1 thioredoxin-dependent thiol peroxidase [Corynebacterium heidelbergense]WCZ36156.1 Putative peroxiredoxin [Corynebacterium heidelbergense]
MTQNNGNSLLDATNGAPSEQVKLQPGDTAPAFSLPADDGSIVSLSDFAGQKVVVYFYPRANTPGCTTEACDFQDSLEQLNGQQVQVIGISPDKPTALQKFRADRELTFPLLSDPEKEVLIAYGAFGEKKNYGRVVQGVIRSTFIVDESGKIAAAKYNVKATGHVARIIKEL